MCELGFKALFLLRSQTYQFMLSLVLIQNGCLYFLWYFFCSLFPWSFFLCLHSVSHLFYMAQTAGFNMHGNDSQHIMWVNAVEQIDSTDNQYYFIAASNNEMNEKLISMSLILRKCNMVASIVGILLSCCSLGPI